MALSGFTFYIPFMSHPYLFSPYLLDDGDLKFFPLLYHVYFDRRHSLFHAGLFPSLWKPVLYDGTKGSDWIVFIQKESSQCRSHHTDGCTGVKRLEHMLNGHMPTWL